ncbi:MAG: hypothetical protein LBE83_00750 [Propionibacteriaceae bacterium]|nr:hypothetical protein [Propionibacteriaceae bacterium]
MAPSSANNVPVHGVIALLAEDVAFGGGFRVIFSHARREAENTYDFG